MLAPPRPISFDLQMANLGPAPRGTVFVPGYYSWNGQRYLWIDPMWAAPPVVGAVWIVPNWTYQQQDGDVGYWVLQEGYWQEPAMPETPDGQPQDSGTIPSSQPLPLPGMELMDGTQQPVEQIAPPAAPPQPTVKSVPLASGRIILPPWNNTSYRMHIGNESEVRVVGDFSTDSPTGVEANINDGRQKGRKTLYYWNAPLSEYGNIDVRLNPGDYFLVLNNPSDQQISVNVNVSLSIRP